MSIIDAQLDSKLKPVRLAILHSDICLLQEMQDIVALCLEKDPQKRPTAEQLLKHRFFKHVKSPKAALEEILTGVPGPVQRLSSLTRRSTEKNLIGGEEAASYGADERVSLRSQKVCFRTSFHGIPEAESSKLLKSMKRHLYGKAAMRLICMDVLCSQRRHDCRPNLMLRQLWYF